VARSFGLALNHIGEEGTSHGGVFGKNAEILFSNAMSEAKRPRCSNVLLMHVPTATFVRVAAARAEPETFVYSFKALLIA